MNKLIILVPIIFFISSKDRSLENLNVLYSKHVEYDKSFLINMDLVQYKNLYNQRKNLLDPLKKLFNLNNFRTLKSKDLTTLKIPKIIHQIWLGSPFPEKYKQIQMSWKKYHPDWEYRLWTDADIKDLNIINKSLYNRATNYGEKSDILRYEILNKFGGLYIDTDFECYESFEPLHYAYEFYTGSVTIDRLGIVANGLIACKPGHPIIKNCLINLLKKANHSTLVFRTGPPFFRDTIIEYINNNPHNLKGILVLPPTYFYCVPNAKEMIKFSYYLKKESFAIHHWAGSWKK